MVVVAAEALRCGGGGRGSKTTERDQLKCQRERDVREVAAREGTARRGREHCEGGRRRRKGNDKGG